jgi:hypothetical protein
VRFFLDNNLAPKLAKGFNQFVAGEHDVIHLRERFDASKKDAEWMAELAGEYHWVIISGDNEIGRNPVEIDAWKKSGHTIFFLKRGWTNIPFWQQVQKLAKCFPDIIEHAKRAKSGDAFFVQTNGRISGG